MHEERGEVEVEGGTVRYRALGEGDRTLVLLHGGPGGGSLYLKPLERLSGPDRRVVLYDQLGCGESDRPHDSSLWRADRFVDGEHVGGPAGHGPPLTRLTRAAEDR